MVKLRESNRIKPQSVSLKELTEAFLGYRWRERLGINPEGNLEIAGKYHDTRLTESDAGAIGPSAFMNVTAWSGAVAGLYAAQMIDSFNNTPEYKIRSLFPDRPAAIWLGGQRLIDIFGPYAPLPKVGPGVEAPSLKLDAIWVETAALQKYAGKVEVAKELAEVDITGGGFLAKSKTVGQMAALRENENAISMITGITNNWKLGFLPDTSATAYNTYNPTITNTNTNTTYALTNQIVNPINDIGCIQKSREAIANLRNPLTGFPIDPIDFTTALVPWRLQKLFEAIDGADTLELLTQLTQNGFQTPPGTFPSAATGMRNPYKGELGTVIGDMWLDERMKRSATYSVTNPLFDNGLGLSDANANRWYRINPPKFGCRLVGWDVSVLDLQPQDYAMAVRALVAGQYCSIATTFQVINPYYVQANTVS